MISLFDSLVEQGNSVFLVEHNLEVLKAADYVLKLGPQGGVEGGQLLFAGTPAQMIECAQSVTAKYLAHAAGIVQASHKWSEMNFI